MMIVECMCCRREIGQKSRNGSRFAVTSGICDDCLDARYPEYAERVRQLRGDYGERVAA